MRNKILLAMLMSVAANFAHASDGEYTIALIPEQKCIDEAKKLNAKAASLLKNHKNLHNNWHITLYHGVFKDSDLGVIKDKLKQLHTKKFSVTFVPPVFDASDRWIDLGVEQSKLLKDLHIKTVDLISPYHVKPLKKAKDVYDSLTQAEKNNIDKYGVQGVLELYKPHITLFYQYPPSADLANAANSMKDEMKSNMLCKVEEMVVGKVAYNGNLTKIVKRIPLADQ